MSKSSYGRRIAQQVLSECVAWGRGQFVALIIAVLSAWAALHWGLVPIAQTRAAYIAYLWPFIPALLGYLLFQLLRAPYALDRQAQTRIGELENESSILRERLKPRINIFVNNDCVQTEPTDLIGPSGVLDGERSVV